MQIHKSWIAVVLAVSTASFGSVSRPAYAEPPGQKDSPKPTDAEKTIKQVMLEDARKVYELNLKRYQFGAGNLDLEVMYSWSSRWLKMELDLTVDAEAKTVALKGHVNRMKDLEKSATALAKTGQGQEVDAISGRYFRTQAELWLVRGRTD